MIEPTPIDFDFQRGTTRQEIIDALAGAVGKLEILRLGNPDPYVRVHPEPEEETARDVLDAVWDEAAWQFPYLLSPRPAFTGEAR